MVHASLKDKPRYEALSYTWGDTSNKRDICMNGHRFPITLNLHIAFQHLREQNGARTLWVDALCINQQNLQERAEQVSKMRDIFWLAQRVLAWTGEPDESDEALELLQELGHPSTFMRLYGLASKPMAFLNDDFSHCLNKFESLFRFLNRPYWSRVWVVQELAIPGSRAGDVGWLEKDKVQIRCCSTWVPFSTFTVACASLVQLIPGILSSVACLSLANPLGQTNPAGLDMFGAVQCSIPTASRQAPSILELLHLTHCLKATDPRDKLYALIALARDEDLALVPDYSISATQMFRELVRHSILTDNNLMVLSGNRVSPPDTGEGSSSWAPNPERFVNSPKLNWDPATTTFNACNSRAPTISFSDDLRHLTAKGIIVDSIDTVIGPFDFKQFPGLFSDDWCASEWASSFRELEQYGSSLSMSERDIFWRTLVLDSGKLGHGGLVSPAPKEIGEWFEVMLNGFAESDAVRAELTKLFYSQAGFVDRCFYATASGGRGIGPYGTLPGDLVAILYGGQFCYILREVSEHYVLVGDAYLHGAMHGELLDQRRQEERRKYEEKDFVLW
ncbi:hypothetical protein AYL99_08928 [Fonsecaea erecta]|uniref:Heterokaryon incompatibility domain-containing protein n=1 Tax=Fonsecaea erecta TaxID=1367422 RepID=A0A178ZBH0_9EURO|nr:hypothetical protein AYL99_08928 [Fonsecaea erecta]OAP56816.1 hypothetical protein AYL99_08928 [Fonsecaea erecta]